MQSAIVAPKTEVAALELVSWSAEAAGAVISIFFGYRESKADICPSATSGSDDDVTTLLLTKT